MDRNHLERGLPAIRSNAAAALQEPTLQSLG